MRRRRFRPVVFGLVLALLPTLGGGANPPTVVLLVTVDTLRADRLGAYGSPLGLTPRLDRLAAESLVFMNAFAPAPFTLPSLAGLMTGRHPEELGVTTNGARVPRLVPRLSQWMSGQGWTTAAVVSSYVLRRKAGLARGFDRYDDALPHQEATRPVPERRAPETTGAALATLDRLLPQRRPVFLWVHYQDPHGPYAPPEHLRAGFLAREREAPGGRHRLALSASQSGVAGLPRYQRLGEEREVAFYRAGYHGEVALVDGEIGRLLDGLAERRLLGGAIVILTSDHGEALGEEDYWFAHGERLDEGLVRVPLLIRTPGRGAARRTDTASLLDVFPTVAGLMQGAPPPTVRGRDLLASATSPALYLSTLGAAAPVRRALVADGHEYLVWSEGDVERERVVRLGEDGRDLAPEQGALLRRLRGQLGQARTALLAVDAAPPPALGLEARERLSALGYATGR